MSNIWDLECQVCDNVLEVDVDEYRQIKYVHCNDCNTWHFLEFDITSDNGPSYWLVPHIQEIIIDKNNK